MTTTPLAVLDRAAARHLHRTRHPVHCDRCGRLIRGKSLLAARGVQPGQVTRTEIHQRCIQLTSRGRLAVDVLLAALLTPVCILAAWAMWLIIP
jgi:hypothetical protein